MDGKQRSKSCGRVLLGVSDHHGEYKTSQGNVEKLLNNQVTGYSVASLYSLPDQLHSALGLFRCGRIEGVDKNVCV
jgi:hypothetical protein